MKQKWVQNFPGEHRSKNFPGELRSKNFSGGLRSKNIQAGDNCQSTDCPYSPIDAEVFSRKSKANRS